MVSFIGFGATAAVESSSEDVVVIWDTSFSDGMYLSSAGVVTASSGGLAGILGAGMY